MPRRRKRRLGIVQYIRLHRGITNSAAWKSLSCSAKSLLLEIWAFHNGFNNGAISYSHEQARLALRIGSKKVTDSFDELIDRGFLVVRRKGSFHVKIKDGPSKATEWEITDEPCDDQPAKKLYRTWKENQNAATAPVARGNLCGARERKNVPWN